jgi:ABC-type multidrug transport system fused ATPase/permease subunit
MTSPTPRLAHASGGRQLFSDLFGLFRGRDRQKALGLLVLIVISSVWETAGIASIGPFLAVISSPDAIEKSWSIKLLYQWSGAPDLRTFDIYLGVASAAMVLAGNALASLTLWLVCRFTFGQGFKIGYRLLAVYLAQPYSFFLRNNTVDLARNVYDEVPRAITGVILPAFYVVARFVSIALITALLIYIDKFVAFFLLAFFGAFYLLMYKGFQRWNTRNRETMTDMRAATHRLSSESLGGIKELKVLGGERSGLQAYAIPALSVADADARHQILATIPKYLLESVGFVALIAIVLFLLLRGDPQFATLPLVAVYGFAGYRMMPALQHLYTNLHFVQYYASSLRLVVAALEQGGPPAAPQSSAKPVAPLPFKHGIEFDDVSFRYPTADVLEHISFRVKAKSVTGIIGTTGSGKSTMLDIMLGLLQPTGGLVRIDGAVLDETTARRWQAGIGYVPQQIFLSDSTIAENIALGQAREEIDVDRLRMAAKAAHVEEFVQELADGYDSRIGERGVRLSGGQRQRIGIARALYRNPDVILFDEATSALDNLTEVAVMDTLQGLTGTKTIVLVAHRLTTLRLCDQIILLENGRIAEQGTYDEMLERSKFFRESHNLGQLTSEKILSSGT